jgi:hypothetical protein
MKATPVVQSLIEPLLLPLVTTITGVFGNNLKYPVAGDYLLDGFAGNYLNDELGNRLTA